MEHNKNRDAAGGPSWTETRLAQLLTLWGKGLNATRIAAALGDGCSRSAVVGKLNRLGLRQSASERNAAQASGGRIARRRARGGPPLIPIAPAPPTPCGVIPRRLALTDLAHGLCRWPCEDAPEPRFCGHPAKPGRSYCAAHHGLAYFAVLPPLTLEALHGSAADDPIPSPARRDR